MYWRRTSASTIWSTKGISVNNVKSSCALSVCRLGTQGMNSILSYHNRSMSLRSMIGLSRIVLIWRKVLSNSRVNWRRYHHLVRLILRSKMMRYSLGPRIVSNILRRLWIRLGLRSWSQCWWVWRKNGSWSWVKYRGSFSISSPSSMNTRTH